MCFLSQCFMYKLVLLFTAQKEERFYTDTLNKQKFGKVTQADLKSLGELLFYF